MRILVFTWNTFRRYQDSKDIHALLCKLATEDTELILVGLQETNRSAINIDLDILGKALGFTYKYCVALGEVCSVIFAKKRIELQVRKQGAYYLGLINKGYVMIYIKNYDIIFINCHLFAGENHQSMRIKTLNRLINDCKLEPSDMDKVSLVVFCGDFNFRQYISQSVYSVDNDQGVAMNSLFPSMKMPQISFKPTFKYFPGTNRLDKLRIPSFTDRVYISGRQNYCIEKYDSLQDVCKSDHKPVFALIYLNTGLEYISRPTKEWDMGNTSLYTSILDLWYVCRWHVIYIFQPFLVCMCLMLLCLRRI